MKRLLIVMVLTITATGCQGGLFNRGTCGSSTPVYSGMVCDDGGAYMGTQVMPAPGM